MGDTEKEKLAEEKSKLYLEKLRRNQEELKKAQRLGKIGNWDWDMATDTITWSDEYYRIFNFDPKKHPPKYKEHLKIYTPESAARLDAAVKRNTKTGEPYQLDLEIADPKNPTRWITARSETIRDSHGKIIGLRGTAQDITERKIAELEILEKNRLLKTISEVNQMIFKERDKEKLLNKICEIIKEYSYKMVWIGLCDEETKSVIPIAQAGFERGYLETIKIKFDSSEYGRGPTGTAIKTGKPNIMRDIASDPRYAPWRKQALKRGFSSSMAIPIFLKEKVIGAISVYSEKKDSFNPEEINLLTELAGDISIALEKFENEEKSKKAEQKLKENEEKYRNVTEKANDGIVIIQDKVIKYGNPALEKIRGDSLKNMINHPFLEYIAPEEKEKIKEYYVKRLRGEKINPKYETILLRKDGNKIWVELNVGLIQYEGKIAELVILRDITERKKAEEKIKLNSSYVRSLIESDLDPLVTIGKDGKISDVNKATEKVTGVSREELIGTDFSDYFTDSKKAEEGYKKVFEEGQVKDYPLSIKHKSGKITDVLYNAVVFRDNLGNVQGVFAAARDITERKKAEEQLKESEEKFRSIFEHSAVGVSIVSIDGRWLKVNRALCKMTGYSEKELLSKGYLQVTLPEDIEKSKKLTKELFSGNKNYGYLEKRYVRKDKKIIWVYLSITVVRDLNNKPQYYVVHTEDITEKKEAEIKLKKYQEDLEQLVKKKTFELEREKTFLNSVVENIPDMVFVKDAEKLRFQLFNKEGEKLLGKKKEILIGKNDYDFFPKSQADFFTQKDRQVLRNKKLLDIPEEPIKTPFGERILHTKKIPILNKEGKSEFLLGISEDITKEKEIEKKYQLIVESIKQGIYTTENGRFVSINKAMSELFGYSEKELLNMNAWELAKPETRKQVMEKFFAKIKNKDYSPETIECIKKDKTLFFAEISINPVRGGKASGIVTNITEEKETEMMKTEFISAISHELRTPITPIKSQLQRVLSTKLDEKEQQESIEIALRNTIRMDRLIQDLLEINRIRAGRFNIFKRKENLNEIIRETIVDLTSSAKEKNTKITFNEGKLPEVNLDRDRILEVIINVLDNAIKYGKGKIFIETKKEDGNILVKIKDNGIGISKEESERIFTPFYRSKRLEVKKYSGTGLGLSISKGIIEAHEGKIWLESEIGKGTTFFIRIPVK